MNIPQSRSPPQSDRTPSPVDLPVRGLDQVACQGGFFVRRGRFRGAVYARSEHSLHQEGHAVMAGDVGGVGEIDGANQNEISVRFTYYKHDHDDRSFETRSYFRW